MFARIALLLLLLLGNSGCALIVRGTTQTVMLRCPVEGAVIKIDGKTIEPGEVELERSKNHTVTVSAQGYEPARFQIQSVTSIPWAFADGLIGATGLVAYGMGVVV